MPHKVKTPPYLLPVLLAGLKVDSEALGEIQQWVDACSPPTTDGPRCPRMGGSPHNVPSLAIKGISINVLLTMVT